MTLLLQSVGVGLLAVVLLAVYLVLGAEIGERLRWNDDELEGGVMVILWPVFVVVLSTTWLASRFAQRYIAWRRR